MTARSAGAESPATGPDARDRFIARSGELFDREFFCAESILMAGAEYLGEPSEAIPRIATGLCGGLSRTCGPCGAVTGAALVIGLAAGREYPEEGTDPAYNLMQTFLERFRGEHGSTNCFDLIGVDLGTQSGRDIFESEDLRLHCRELVTRTAGILAELLEPDRE